MVGSMDYRSAGATTLLVLGIRGFLEEWEGMGKQPVARN